jgi:hypothetical protein
MGKGHEDLHTLQEALAAFEEAIRQRERRNPLTSKVSTKQVADEARQHVVEVVVKMVTAARMGRESS